MIEDEMVGWHHQLNGHEFEQTPGGSEGQGSLACCSPCSLKELDPTQGLKNTTTWSLCVYLIIFKQNCVRTRFPLYLVNMRSNWTSLWTSLSRWLSGKESACRSRRHRRCGFNSELERCPGEGNGNLLQYSCLGNPMTEEPGGLQSTGSQRVGHNSVTEKEQTGLLQTGELPNSVN